MKSTLCVACFAAVLMVVYAAGDAGHFIPKAFYTLDADGHKSDLHPVSPHTAHYLRRLRRQTYPQPLQQQQQQQQQQPLAQTQFSSSSSSSSVSSDGGPVYFSSQQVLQQSSDAGIANRFGGSSSTGHVVQTTGVVDKNGQVHYKQEESHF